MRHVHGPEEPDLMVPSVQPIVQEVFRKQENEPIGEDIGDADPVMVITNSQDHHVNASEQQIDNTVEQHKVHIGQCIFQRVRPFMTLPVIAKEYFQPDDDKIKRAADKEEYLFSEIFHDVKINEITDLRHRVLSAPC